MKKMFYPEIILPPVGILSAFLLCLTPLQNAEARHPQLSPTYVSIRTVSGAEEIEVTGTVRDKQGFLTALNAPLILS